MLPRSRDIELCRACTTASRICANDDESLAERKAARDPVPGVADALLHGMARFERFAEELMVLGSVLAMAGCGEVAAPSSPDAGTAVDTTPPRITSITPADGASRISVLTSITVTFDEPLDPATIGAAAIRVMHSSQSVRSGAVSYDDATRTITFTLAQPLPYGTYWIDVAGVDDLAGNTSTPVTSKFRTFINAATGSIYYDAGVIYDRSQYTLDAEGWWADNLNFSGPGPDQTWLTPDDVLDGRATYKHDADGNLQQFLGYSGPGPDQSWHTADDVVSSATVYAIGPQGRGEGYSSYSGPGPDTVWSTADDVLRLYRTHTWEGDRLLGSTAYTEPGPDGIWRTTDDVISSYEEREYDDGGRLVRLVSYDAAGLDGVWKTDDDDVSQYTTRTYDPNGHLMRDVTFIQAGADGQWFTSDDGIRSAHSYVHSPAGLELRRRDSQGVGPDGVWFTPDDEGYMFVSTYDARGLQVERRTIFHGPDGMLGTPDDVASSLEVYDYDQDGNRTERRYYNDAGPDKIFKTSDDDLGVRGSYDVAH